MSKEGKIGRRENSTSHPHEIEVFSRSPREIDRLPPTEIGPESLLRKLLGDRRFALTGMSAGILQLMHPAVGAGVVEHSDFFNDPWGRILRSLPEIIGSVCDQNPAETARKVRKYHNSIQGVDEKGRPYHALNDETFWWPHATFTIAAKGVRDRFDRNPLSLDEREQLYQESKTWYSLYGMSNRPVPKDYASFVKKWDDICNNTLEFTPAAKVVVDKIKTGKVDRRPDIPEFLWNKLLFKLPGNELIRILSFGGLSPVVRKKLDIRWSRFDQMKLTMIEGTVKYFWPRDWPDDLPDIRIDPRARAGIEARHKFVL
jgi:uncharacterized protein (DUF2236 family)